MRILRLRSYFYPENVAASAMNEDFENELVKRGIYSVNYTPMPSRGVSDAVRNEYRHKKHETLKDGYVIVHRFSMIKEGTGFARRTLKFMLCTIAEYFKGIGAKDIDVVYGASTPPTQGLLCAVVAKRLSGKYRRKVPFVYNLQDIFPDSLVNAGMTKKGSLVWKIGRKIEDHTYRGADKIIVISEDFKSNIMAKGVPADKIVVVPNWADTDGIRPVAREENILFDRYGLERDRFYISYSGNVGYTQNMELLLDAAKAIQNERKEVRFVIIGEGAAKADVEKRIREENIRNVTLLPFQPYEDIAHVFSLGDVGLIISRRGVGSNSVPSKTWGYMAAGRPILASFDKGSALSGLIGNVGCGICAEADSREELIGAILAVTADPCLAEKGKRGETYLRTELDKETCVNAYIDTLTAAAWEDRRKD